MWPRNSATQQYFNEHAICATRLQTALFSLLLLGYGRTKSILSMLITLQFLALQPKVKVTDTGCQEQSKNFASLYFLSPSLDGKLTGKRY